MRLIIFGDSFAHPHKADYVWTNKITERLKATQQINYANNGASIEYCLYKLDHYIKNDYDVDDNMGGEVYQKTKDGEDIYFISPKFYDIINKS